MGRSKKALANMTSYAVYELISFIKNIFIGHLILVAYGSDYNGLISSITQVVSIFAVVRAGIFGATRVELFKPLAENNTERISQILNSCSKSMRRITLLLSIYIFALAIAYPLFVSTAIIKYEVIYLVVLLGCSTIAEYLFGFSSQILINADQSIYIFTIIQTLLLVFSAAASYICITLSSSFIVMKTISCVITALAPIILYLIVRRRYKIKRNEYLELNDEKRLSRNRFSAMWHALSTIVNEKADVVLITLFMTTLDVSVYSVYMLIINVIIQLFNAICDSFSASFGSMYANNEFDKFKKYFKVYEYLIQIFVVLIFSCTITLLCPFVSIYTKGVSDTQYILPIFSVLIATVGILTCIKTPYYTIVVMAGHYQQTKKEAAVEPILNLLISIVLINYLGLYGVLIGSIIAGIYWGVFLINYSNQKVMFEKSQASFISNLLIIIFTYIIVAIQEFAISFINVDSYIKLIIAGFISIAISGAACLVYTMLFRKREFADLVAFIKTMVKRRT